MTPIFMNTLPDMICIDVMPTYVASPLTMIGPSGNKSHWNIQMTPACIFMNTLPDMICIDVMSTYVASPLTMIGPSGNKSHWNIQMTPACIFMNTLPDMICIDVMSTYVASPLTMIGPSVNRYEFQGVNRIGIFKWVLREYATRYDLQWYYVDFMWYCPSKWLNPQRAGMSFRVKPFWNNRMTPTLILWIHCQTRSELLSALWQMIGSTMIRYEFQEKALE